MSEHLNTRSEVGNINVIEEVLPLDFPIPTEEPVAEQLEFDGMSEFQSQEDDFEASRRYRVGLESLIIEVVELKIELENEKRSKMELLDRLSGINEDLKQMHLEAYHDLVKNESELAMIRRYVSSLTSEVRVAGPPRSFRDLGSMAIRMIKK